MITPLAFYENKITGSEEIPHDNIWTMLIRISSPPSFIHKKYPLWNIMRITIDTVKDVISSHAFAVKTLHL